MKRVFVGLGAGLAVIIFSAFSALHSSGYSLATGSPYDGGACGQCHTGTVGTVSVNVIANPAFGVGDTYLQGTTYTVSAIVSGSFAQYGFDLEMLNSNGSSSVGDAGTCGPALTSNCQKVSFTSNPTNYTHTAPSGSSNSATFSFQWTAPASGPVYIYCAGLGANGNHADNGDKVKTFSLMLSPATGIEENQENNHDLKLFPSPSGDGERISYELKTAGNLTVKLCNSNGQELQTVISGYQERGLHEFTLQEKLPRGIYLVQISLNGNPSTQKLFID